MGEEAPMMKCELLAKAYHLCKSSQVSYKELILLFLEFIAQTKRDFVNCSWIRAIECVATKYCALVNISLDHQFIIIYIAHHCLKLHPYTNTTKCSLCELYYCILYYIYRLVLSAFLFAC
jgi:hypothetical protein